MKEQSLLTLWQGVETAARLNGICRLPAISGPRRDKVPAKFSARNVYIDFGRRKPHAVLFGTSRKVKFVRTLRELALKDCLVYLEEGCPPLELLSIADANTILQVNGTDVRALREELGLLKSDFNDVLALRELARRNPRCFRELTPKEREDISLQLLYSQYFRLTTIIASLKNQRRNFFEHFTKSSSELDSALELLESLKLESSALFDRFRHAALKLHVKGAGPRYVGGILIKAHPKRFRTLSAYLAYCGFKAYAERSGRFSHHVRSLYHQLATSVIMHKDEWFYPLYIEIKGHLSTRFPYLPKFKIDAMARNRISTMLAKVIYFSQKQTMDRIRP